MPRKRAGMPLATPLGAKLESLRKARQWTAAELARQAGVDRSTISLIEAGKRKRIGATIRGKLERALGESLTIQAPIPPTADNVPATGELAAQLLLREKERPYTREQRLKLLGFLSGL